jgi:outer membrane protein assembly factor BamB
VYAGSQDGYVYAVNATSGKLVWKFMTGGPIKPTPGFDAGILYVGSGDGNVYALDARFGLPYWQYQGSAASAVDTTPVAAREHLFFATLDGHVFSLKLPGQLVMSTATPAPAPAQAPTPTPTPKPTPTLVPLPCPTPAPAPLSPAAGLAGIAVAAFLLYRRRR